MNLSELVAQAIMEMLDASDGSADIRRNELASSLGCVPSQINYVITSRFTPENGYSVESRRGGGGYIRIKRIYVDGPSVVMHVINGIGQTLDLASARAIISDLCARGLLSKPAARIILSGCGDNSLRDCPAEARDKVRAAMLKQMLLNAVQQLPD